MICVFVWNSQPLNSIFGLVNSSIKKIRLEWGLHPIHSMICCYFNLTSINIYGWIHILIPYDPTTIIVSSRVKRTRLIHLTMYSVNLLIPWVIIILDPKSHLRVNNNIIIIINNLFSIPEHLRSIIPFCSCQDKVILIA